MKNVLKSRFLWVSALMLTLGIAGCNIFNPTESINIKNDDADALTYEGYIKFLDNEYTEAVYYFEKAIAADSSHSEAWFGLIKAKLNEEHLNAFKLLKYSKTERNTNLPMTDLHGEDSIYVEDTLSKAIAVVHHYATLFKQYDKEGKLDGVVSMSDKSIADGYMVLQLLNTLVTLRETTNGLSQCKNSTHKCNMGEVLNSIKNDTPEQAGKTITAFHEVFSGCTENPSSITDFAGQLVTEWDLVDETLTDNAQNATIKGLCNALANETNSTDPDEQAKALNIIISQLDYGIIGDDDGDGCIDEEVFDGEDNDGDGEIDEDTRNKTILIEYDKMRMAKNVAAAKGRELQTNELLVIASARPSAKYENVDIDMDGRTYAQDDNYTDEWDFVYKDYDKRQRNSNHQFVFAQSLQWNERIRTDFGAFLKDKRAIAKDKDGSIYNLRMRQELVGGCWNNYSEKDFQKFIEKNSRGK